MSNESNIQNKKSFVACFNLIKLIAFGYALIALLIGCIAYTWHHEWQEVEALEIGNQRIDDFRKEVNRIHIQMIEFSLMGETVLDWNETDLENYHAQRIALDSTLCSFNATYPIERVDSVRYLLENKERQMFQIVRLMDEQQSINKKIASQAPVIVQKIVQEQPKKPKRKGFLGIFGKKEAHPTFRVMRQSCRAYSLSSKYRSSLNPYAVLFITFILLLIPSTFPVDIWQSYHARIPVRCAIIVAAIFISCGTLLS